MSRKCQRYHVFSWLCRTEIEKFISQQTLSKVVFKTTAQFLKFDGKMSTVYGENVTKFSKTSHKYLPNKREFVQRLTHKRRQTVIKVYMASFFGGVLSRNIRTFAFTKT